VRDVLSLTFQGISASALMYSAVKRWFNLSELV
jgi:hypothetical protein